MVTTSKLDEKEVMTRVACQTSAFGTGAIPDDDKVAGIGNKVAKMPLSIWLLRSSTEMRMVAKPGG